jgi:hypothetical protein
MGWRILVFYSEPDVEGQTIQWAKEKGQSNKTPHSKLNIEQHEPH